MGVRGRVRHGKSGPPLARGCFLLVLVLPLLLLLLLLVGVVDEAHALTPPQQSALALVLSNSSVKFRGSRSALMHPTAMVFSPPDKNSDRQQQQPLKHLGSSSSTFLSPGVVSRAPSTRAHLDPYSDSVPSLATPAITPAPHTPRPHTWASGAGGYNLQPPAFGFGLNRGTRPKWSRSRMEGVGGWAAMNTPTGQDRWLSSSWTQHTPDMSDSTRPYGSVDTFGLGLSEGLSHRQTRWQQEKITEPEEGGSPVGGRGWAGRRGTGTVFNGEVDDEGGRSIFDLNATSEYQPDDYKSYHEYDLSNTSWQPSEHIPSPTQDPRILTIQHVMEIQGLASLEDLYALLDQRGITLDKLQNFLNDGARKEDVPEFLKAPAPTTIVTTTTSPPVLSHPPSAHDTSVVEEGYPDDVTRQASLPATSEDNYEQESKEKSRKNRKKDRRGKGGRRKNRRRKGKNRQKEDASDVSPTRQVNDTTETPATDPWLLTTTSTLPDTSSTTATTRDILLPTTQPPTPDTLATSPSPGRTSDVSIVSVTLVEAPSDPQPETPDQTTFVESITPPRKKNTHTTTHFWDERNPRKIHRPAKASPEPEQTINEIEKVNFVREKQRDDYVFPLRGLLIISGLMGALAVFTLVVLISYAVIKCSKKPVVNNYQVSQQQKPAGT